VTGRCHSPDKYGLSGLVDGFAAAPLPPASFLGGSDLPPAYRRGDKGKGAPGRLRERMMGDRIGFLCPLSEAGGRGRGAIW
jgi:hypothetical protein